MKLTQIFAWAARDAWGGRRELTWSLSCLLAATLSFQVLHHVSRGIENSINDQARELSGGDLALVSPYPLAPAQLNLVTLALTRESLRIQGEAETVEMLTMLVPLDEQDRVRGHTRLVELHAAGDTFPLYGAFRRRTADLSVGGRPVPSDGRPIPAVALGSDLHALLGANRIRIGQRTFEVRSEIESEPGGALSVFPIAPHIWIAKKDLEETRLLQRGSRVRHKYFWSLDRLPSPDFVERLKKEINDDRLQIHSASGTSTQVEKLYDRVFRFTRLSSLLAMTLALFAAAVSLRLIYAGQARTRQTLHVMGLSPRDVTIWNAFQIVFLFGAGTALGWGVGTLMDPWISHFLLARFHLQLEPRISIPQELKIAGLYVALMTTLIATRLSTQWRVRLPGAAITLGITMYVLEDWRWGVGYWLVVLGVLFIFRALTHALLWLLEHTLVSSRRFSAGARVRLLALARFPKVTAQGMSGVGLGLFLVFGLFIFRDTLRTELAIADAPDAPQLFLIDVGTDQKSSIDTLLEKFKTPAHWSRFAKARLLAVNGQAPVEVPDEERLHREFNLNDRDELDPSEVLTAGHWWTGRARVDATAAEDVVLEASVEEDFARRMGLRLGDHVQFDLQGVTFQTVIINTRRIDWASFHPNFYFLIQPGFLDTAPQSWIAALNKSARADTSNLKLQDAITSLAPNVTVVDITQTLGRIKELMHSVDLVVTCLAALILATGLLLLLSSIFEMAELRKNETALLRVLGCSPTELAGAARGEAAIWATLMAFVAAPLAAVVMSFLIKFVFHGAATLATRDQGLLLAGFLALSFFLAGRAQKGARA